MIASFISFHAQIERILHSGKYLKVNTPYNLLQCLGPAGAAEGACRSFLRNDRFTYLLSLRTVF